MVIARNDTASGTGEWHEPVGEGDCATGQRPTFCETEGFEVKGRYPESPQAILPLLGCFETYVLLA